MKKYLIIEEFLVFKKVKYYTIRFEVDGVLDEENETDKFFSKFSDSSNSHYEEFMIIFNLIKAIGSRGAKDIFFRPELRAKALPSSPGLKAGVEIKSDTALRLYCVKVNEEIVILCSGDIKTKNRAQECPKVSYHFRLANTVSKKVDDEDLNFYDGQELGFYI